MPSMFRSHHGRAYAAGTRAVKRSAKVSAPAGSRVPNADTAGAAGIWQAARRAGAAFGRFPVAKRPEGSARVAKAAASPGNHSLLPSGTALLSRVAALVSKLTSFLPLTNRRSDAPFIYLPAHGRARSRTGCRQFVQICMSRPMGSSLRWCPSDRTVLAGW